MRVSVDEMLKPESNNTTGQAKKNQFFTLSNDGDSAIVRFLHSDVNDFDVLDVHNIQLGGFNRKINCLRPVDGAKDECAICMHNDYDEEKGSYKYPLQRRIFIHLLRYDTPNNPIEQVWERSAKDFVKKLMQLVEDYGPLYQRMYKIVRHGAAGSNDTTYDILPLDKDRFNPANYAFNEAQLNYKPVLETFVLNKTNEEIEEYLATGNFPGFKGSSNGITPHINAVQTDIDDSQIPTNPTATYNPEPRPAQVNNYQPQQSTAYNPPRYNYDPIANPLGGDRRRV